MSSHTASVDAAPAHKKESRFSGRLSGLLVIATIALPMLAAFLIFHSGIGIPKATVNKGELLLPAKSIAELPLRDTQGQALNILEGDKKWRLLIPAYGHCGQSCQKSLYLTRQVHVRLGEKASRVERFYLNLDAIMDAETEGYLNREHPRVKRVHIQRSDLEAFLANTNASGDPVTAGRYFLMDQEGFVMMAYTPKHDGNQLLTDLKRLLKYSYEG